MNQISKSLWITITAVSAVFGYLIGFLLVKWGKNFPRFLEVSIGDILQLLVTVILATGVAVWIKRKSSREEHRSQLLLDLIGGFHKDIDKIFDLGTRYMDSMSPNLQRSVLRQFKSSSCQLRLIFDVHEMEHLSADEAVCTSLWLKFLSFKKNLTDDPFMQQGKTYSADQKEKFELLHRDILRLTYKLRLQTYI